MSVKEFKPKSWAAPVEDLVKEAKEQDRANVVSEPTQEEKTAEAESMVRRGLINPHTGEYGENSKARKVATWIPSEEFRSHYELTFGHA